MGVPKRLTEMQKRFAECLVFGGPDGPVNKAEAAKLAGYSEKRCRQEGTELTNPKHAPLVVRYIDELKQEKMLKYGVTYEGHIEELDRIKQLLYCEFDPTRLENGQSSIEEIAILGVK